VVGDSPEVDPASSAASSDERSRRQLLIRGGGVLGVAAFLAGCTSKVAQPSNVHIDPHDPGAQQDGRVLNELLAGEYRSIYTYTAAIPLLPQPPSKRPAKPPQNHALFAPPPKPVNKNAPPPALKLQVPLAYAAAQQFLTQELSHVSELTGLIKQTGARLVHPKSSYQLGPHSTKEEVLRLLHHNEEQLLATYSRAIPQLTPSSLRGTAAAIFANHAQHSTVLRLDLGLPPIPSAFVGRPE
jgi:hypothetical protein